jgi:histidinol-phosphate phosphatase family protein
MGLKPAIFLDRDGVLCENRTDYIKNEAELVLFPWTTLAMRVLAQLDTYIFVFTNQSAIERRILPFGTAQNINNRLKYLIELGGGRIDDVFMCPHVPESNCKCRKPKNGMIYQALAKYPDINLDDVTIIGDQMTDLVKIPEHKFRYFLVQSGLPTNLPRALWGKVQYLPSIMEAAKQIRTWQIAKDSDIIAKNVVSI